MTVHDAAASVASARARRLRRANATVRRAVEMLRDKYHVRRVVLVGSLSGGERFGFHSDIDLGVAGLSPDRYFEAAGDLLLLAGEFDLDLIPIENATPAMAQRLRDAEVLYAQG